MAGEGPVRETGEDGERPLVCPGCARAHPPGERFCEACGMPLVQRAGAAEQVLSERQERARKIKPQYAEGELVKVGRAENQVEAEFIAAMLLEEGIPSVLRRAGGINVPYAPIVGPRDVLVPESGAEAAREALAWEQPQP
jgi:Putative prokaryotic signal transducing protein